MNNLKLIWDSKERLADDEIPSKVKQLLFLCSQLDTTAHVNSRLLVDFLRVLRKKGTFKSLSLQVGDVVHEIDADGRWVTYPHDLLYFDDLLAQLL